ncbi:ABC-type multidrug transport system, ATPase component [Actinacidiphila yanglinensis]|uniref:ABC-type multidrug transport system, ATPase component n=1 Tax=Actinacidiphila yanglinensis TaxID=310779 RepID=A0A1H5X2C3_9ACTN|nr:ATP-binding cassette domain-containing protein [Actinacidiphila yanglinensis]SEG05515.1 ABC-type multidrug transport system, ATPase component [Actinacidiphila yanglinensis]
MIQAIGLTSFSRRKTPPAVADLTFEVREGEVTGLLGPTGSGKSTALRLLLGVQAGRGATLVDGRPLHELARPAHDIGSLLGDVPGHPRRSARGHLRMLCAAYGLPLSRADEILDVVGLDAVAEERLETHSLGMDRRLGFAVALLSRPRALILDDPARGLLPREAAWVHELVRRHAAEGGAVLLTGRDAGALARTSDRVIALDGGRLVADETADQFARSRLRPYVAVRSPYAQRLAELLSGEGAEVVAASGSRIAVYGTTSAVVGETAYRHGILLHELADTTGDRLERPPAQADPEERAVRRRRFATRRVRRIGRRPGPVRAIGYEVRRAFGVRTPWPTVFTALACSVLATVWIARTGSANSSPLRMLSGWAPELPIPASAIGAGLLGALSYGQEFRFPALAPGHGPEPRSSRLLRAKLLVGALTALALAFMASAADVAVLRLIAPARVPDPLDHPAALAGCAALTVGCCWAGVLAAAVFRTTALGLSAVLAVPLLAVPGVRALLGGRQAKELGDAGGALWSVVTGVSQDGGGGAGRVLRFVGQPFFLGLALSLTVLVGAFAVSALRGRRQERRSTAVPTAGSATLTGKKG